MNIDLNLEHLPVLPKKKDYRIGAIGAGFIMRDIHLVAYKNAGFNVVAIASKDAAGAHAAAELRGIPKVYETWPELLADDSIEVIDIAVPPAGQPAILHAALEHKHIRGILAQKPLATNYRDAQEMVAACERAGVKLCVNQNMRYDHSIRALKTVLRRGYLGEPVLATIDMRAIPHWQPWAKEYDQVTLVVHEHPSPRFLPLPVRRSGVCLRQCPSGSADWTSLTATASCSTSWNTQTACAQRRGTMSWTGPSREGGAADLYIKWRVEGTDGMAQGTIGWPAYPDA